MEKEKQLKNGIGDKGEIKITEESIKKRKEEEQEKLEELTREKYKVWQNAENEREEMKKELNKAFEATSNAEKTETENNTAEIIKKYAGLMDKITAECKIAWREYVESCVKSNKRLTEEYGLTYKDRHTKGPGELLDKSIEGKRKIFGEE